MDKLTTLILKPGELTGWNARTISAITEPPTLLAETADEDFGITGSADQLIQFAQSLMTVVTNAKAGTDK